MPVQGHIHLQGQDDRPWTTDDAPDNTYGVLFKKMGEDPVAFVDKEEALDGTAHVWQLVDGSGDVIQRTNYKQTLFVTQAEYIELLTERGKKVDYIPNIHPNAGSSAAAYVIEMILTKVKIEEVDPMLTYLHVTVTLEEIT